MVYPQTDLYAMGLVVFGLIAGRGPFDDERDARSLAESASRSGGASLSSFVPVRPSVDELLARVLAKNPAKRPRTAMAFAQELFVLQQITDRPRCVGGEH